MSYANNEFCFFFSNAYTIWFFNYAVVMIRMSSILLKGSVNSRHPCCFPDLKESAFSISPSLIFLFLKIKKKTLSV